MRPGKAHPAKADKANPDKHRAKSVKNCRYALLKNPENLTDEQKTWMAWAQRCRIPVFMDPHKKIKRHFDAIVAAAEHKLSNARCETTNNKIKLVIRMAYGFQNVENMIAMVMLSMI